MSDWDGGVVYIAGKIAGDPDYWQKFERAERDLTAKGWIVINPARLPAGMAREKYMPICLAMLEQADVICMLDTCDTYSSKGAELEWRYAMYQGITVYVGTEYVPDIRAVDENGDE